MTAQVSDLYDSTSSTSVIGAAIDALLYTYNTQSATARASGSAVLMAIPIGPNAVRFVAFNKQG